MADGRLVPSLGVWKGRVTVGGVSCVGSFQVLNSNGAWALLFGKPLLETFKAVHDYSQDTIALPQGNGWVTLENQFVNRGGITGDLLANLMIDIKQLVDVSGEVSDDRTYSELIANKSLDIANKGTAKIEEVAEQEEQRVDDKNKSEPQQSGEDCSEKLGGEEDHVWIMDSTTQPGVEQPDVSRTFEPTLLTWKTDPCNPACVKAILQEIMLGQDLTPAQREAICLLIYEYMGCFALSMGEVTVVEGATLRLNIP